MGIRESLTVNFEDKTLEYKGIELYVIKQFEYEEKTYLYCVDEKTMNTENVEVYFLYKVKDDIFNHIDNESKCLELLDVVSGKIMEDIVKSNAEDVLIKKDTK